MTAVTHKTNINDAPIIVGAKYRLGPKKTNNIFILHKISGDSKRVQISNIDTQAVTFWRKVDDLYWVNSKLNQDLLEVRNENYVQKKD